MDCFPPENKYIGKTQNGDRDVEMRKNPNLLAKKIKQQKFNCSTGYLNVIY